MISLSFLVCVCFFTKIATVFANLNFYSHHVNDILGRSISLEKYKGNVSFIFIFIKLGKKLFISKLLCLKFTLKYIQKKKY